MHFSLKGNYQDSLRDATTAHQLQPTYLKAIVRGNFFFSFGKVKNYPTPYGALISWTSHDWCK